LLIFLLPSFFASDSDLKDTCNRYYRIQKNDYLGKIAQDLGLAAPNKMALRLAKINKINDPNLIFPGQNICVDLNLIFEGVIEYPSAPLSSDLGKIQKQTKDDTSIKDSDTSSSKDTLKKTDELALKKNIETSEEEEEEEEEVLIGLGFAPYFLYSKIDSTQISNNAKATVLSKVDYGAEFKVIQLWSDYLNSEVFIQAERRKYTTKSSRTFLNDGGALLNFGAGLGFNFWKRMGIKLRAMFGDEFYLRAPNVNTFSLDDAKVFKGDISLSVDIAKRGSFSSGLGIGTRIISPTSFSVEDGSSYNTKTGYGYFASLYLKHKISFVMLEESFTYEYINKDTDIFKQTHSAMYLKASAIFAF
jgi:LysM repeat protein